jgi:hypothetical protein
MLNLDKAFIKANGTKTGQMIHRMTAVMRGRMFGLIELACWQNEGLAGKVRLN